MDLAHVISACESYERRAADIYRSFAARTGPQPDACALWTALARDEDEHARTLERASARIEPTEGWRVHLEGWRDALSDIEERMRQAEDPRIGADFDRQLTAALALERTELDHLYHYLLGVTRSPVSTEEHLARWLSAAEQRADPAVQMQVAMLRARMRLALQTAARGGS
jgi:rubrerythrin